MSLRLSQIDISVVTCERITFPFIRVGGVLHLRTISDRFVSAL